MENCEEITADEKSGIEKKSGLISLAMGIGIGLAVVLGVPGCMPSHPIRYHNYQPMPQMHRQYVPPRTYALPRTYMPPRHIMPPRQMPPRNMPSGHRH